MTKARQLNGLAPNHKILFPPWRFPVTRRAGVDRCWLQRQAVGCRSRRVAERQPGHPGSLGSTGTGNGDSDAEDGQSLPSPIIPTNGQLLACPSSSLNSWHQLGLSLLQIYPSGVTHRRSRKAAISGSVEMRAPFHSLPAATALEIDKESTRVLAMSPAPRASGHSMTV